MFIHLLAMDTIEGNICQKFGERLRKFMKKANISYSKVHHATQISENHIKKTVQGKVNIGLLHVELYAKLFGVEVFHLFDYERHIPSRDFLQEKIRNHFKSIGYKSEMSFKKLGPSYIVEEFIQESEPFGPMEASKIKDLCNKAKGTSYKTNDVSRVLDNLAAEDILAKTKTGNAKKPTYQKVANN